MTMPMKQRQRPVPKSSLLLLLMHCPTQHHPGLTVPFQNVGRLLGFRFGMSGASTSPLLMILRTFFIIILNTFGYFLTRLEVSLGSVFRLNRNRRFDCLAWNIDWANMDLVCFLWTWDFIPSGYPHINFQSLYLKYHRKVSNLVHSLFTGLPRLLKLPIYLMAAVNRSAVLML